MFGGGKPSWIWRITGSSPNFNNVLWHKDTRAHQNSYFSRTISDWNLLQVYILLRLQILTILKLNYNHCSNCIICVIVQNHNTPAELTAQWLIIIKSKQAGICQSFARQKFLMRNLPKLTLASALAFFVGP